MEQQQDFGQTGAETFFFVARLEDHASRLLVDQISLLRDCVRLSMARFPFRIRATCVLPAELLMIWDLPAHDPDFDSRWTLLSTTFARHLPGEAPRRLWARGPLEHRIRDADELERHVQHCLTAPVRAGLVAQPEDWPFSSIHQARPAANVAHRPPDAAIAPARPDQDRHRLEITL